MASPAQQAPWALPAAAPRAETSDSIALAAFPAADSDPLLLQPALSSAVLVRTWEPPSGARPSNRAPYDDDFEVSAHLADNPHASSSRGKTHFMGAHSKAAVGQLTGLPQPCDAAPPDATLSGDLRETSRARFASLPEVQFCNAEPERVAASAFISGEPAKEGAFTRPGTNTHPPASMQTSPVPTLSTSAMHRSTSRSCARVMASWWLAPKTKPLASQSRRTPFATSSS